MRNADESTIYYCALYDTFSEMYYQLKDYVKGKTYRDSVFLEKTRKLSSEYEKVSDNYLKNRSFYFRWNEYRRSKRISFRQTS